MDVEKRTVKLGDREFVLQTPCIKDAKMWKARFLNEIKPLFDQIGELPDLKFDTPEDVLKLWPLAENLLLAGVDQVIELLFAFSAELQREREWIESHATERQAVEAFRAALELADPFGLTDLFGGRAGPVKKPMSARLPSRSGGSPKRK